MPNPMTTGPLDAEAQARELPPCTPSTQPSARHLTRPALSWAPLTAASFPGCPVLSQRRPP